MDTLKDNQQDSFFEWSNDIDASELTIIDNTKNDSVLVKNNTPNMVVNNEQKKVLSVDEIVKIEIDNCKSCELIEYQWLVSKYSQELFETMLKSSDPENSNYNHQESIKISLDDENHEKIKSIISYLKWISYTSSILANRIGQELLTDTEHTGQYIVRSSYNFCDNTSSCKNFYHKTEKPICSDHHYVHSILRHDIDSVVSYLVKIENFNKFIYTDEFNNILSSMKTICFVSNHMRIEIEHVNFVTKNNSEHFHRNNPFTIRKKNNNGRNINNHSDTNKFNNRNEKSNIKGKYNHCRNNNNSKNNRSNIFNVLSSE
jgi:hypothetical protein